MAYIEDTNLIEEIKSLKISLGGKNLLSEEIKESVLRVINEQPIIKAVKIPEGGIGELSDGYHTFNELYHHRAILFSVICNSMPDKAWKSKLHDTGDMYDGMFIVGIETPDGQATYHYNIEPYWDMFKVKELEKAPKWDGHTPTEAINRLSNISTNIEEVKHGEWVDDMFNDGHKIGSVCEEYPATDEDGNPFEALKGYQPYRCPHCGADMRGAKDE